MLQRVDEMTSPPIIGEKYLVPCVFVAPELTRRGQIEATMFEGLRSGWWPVTGPRHEDAEHILFEHQHYHYDYRFLSKAQFENRYRRSYVARAEGASGLFALPLTDRRSELPSPELRVRVCVRDPGRFPRASAPWMQELEEAFAGKCLKTCKVCPHRGIPLGSMPVDNEGFITCPGHGLRWHATTGELFNIRESERKARALSAARRGRDAEEARAQLGLGVE